MKALSMRQPFVQLILSGRKTIEVRPHLTRHRGELLLHASGVFGPREKEILLELRAAGIPVADPDPAAFGALVGLVRVADARPMTASDWAAALTDPRPGEWWAWVLDSPESFPAPIPYRGRRFMWDVPDAAFAEAAAAG